MDSSFLERNSMKMNKKRQGGLLVVFGILTLALSFPHYLSNPSVEGALIYICPGIFMMGVGVYKLF